MPKRRFEKWDIVDLATFILCILFGSQPVVEIKQLQSKHRATKRVDS